MNIAKLWRSLCLKKPKKRVIKTKVKHKARTATKPKNKAKAKAKTKTLTNREAILKDAKAGKLKYSKAYIELDAQLEKEKKAWIKKHPKETFTWNKLMTRYRGK